MSISDTKKYCKIALIYLLCAIFLALFGAVYEHFSFGVYSGFMLYAFVFPLVGGALPALSLALWEREKTILPMGLWLYRAGIATFSVGCIIRGVLEIYGTENPLTLCYRYVGLGLCIPGGGLILYSLLKTQKH